MADMTTSDALALRGNNGAFGNDFMGIFGLLILLGILNGGFGGFGGGANQYATREQVQSGFDALNSADSQRDILNAVTTAGTNGIASTKEAQYETISVMKDAQVALTRELGLIGQKGESILAKLNECCCTLRYEALGHKNDILERMNGMERRITERLTEDKIERMQNEINELRLRENLVGVVRYPSTATFNAGNWPFAGGATATTT